MSGMRVKGAIVAIGLAALAGPWTLQVMGQSDDGLVVRQRSPHTGRPTFAATRGAGVLVPVAASSRGEERARAFLDQHGAEFGVGARGDLTLVREGAPDDLGTEHVRFQQLYKGVPVTGSQFVVHLRGNRVVAVNGDPIDTFPASVAPAFPADSAIRSARLSIEKSRRVPGPVQYSEPRLEVFNRGRLESRRTESHLAWFIEATGDGLRQFMWVDAQTNELIFQFSQLAQARNRAIHTAGGTSTLPGTLVRSEGQGPTGDADQDNAYDYSGSFYDYFFNTFGRDSYDGAGALLRSTAHYVAPGCPDLFWNGSQVVICEGYGTSDDVVAHEFMHALVENEPSLFNFGQPGALGESLADIFGETIDQLNGLGNDTAGQKWVIGENLAGGPLRNMMTPTLFDDPGKMSDPMWCDLVNDHAGVHTNNGIPNHAYALMVDGGSYNGYTIAGIGLAKAARIHYRALTTYLTITSTFVDYFNAVTEACTDLVGSSGISVADCNQVTNALLAVEMTSTWGCAAPKPEPALCPAGGTPSYVFQDGFESSLGNWIVASHPLPAHNGSPAGTIGPGTWITTTAFPAAGVASAFGDDVAVRSDHTLSMASSVAIPAGARLSFDHFFEFEIDALGEVPENPVPGGGGYFNFDGGVLEYSTNGGVSWQDAGSLIDGGVTYGGTIDDREGDFGNPLLGRMAFVGYQPEHRRTRLDLSSLSGQNVRFRFRIGTDESVPDTGWLVDNVGIYTCAAGGGAPAILSGPQSQAVAPGANVIFSVTASGASLRYQWLKNGVAIPGATAASLSLTNVQASSAGSYSVIVSNDAGTAHPDPALLTVILPGGWGGQSTGSGSPLPLSFTVAGNVASLTSVTAEGAFNSCNQALSTAVAAPISVNQFSVDTGATTCGVRIRAQGAFNSASSASGTIIMNLDNSGPGCALTCNGHYVASWTATAGAPTITLQPRHRTAPTGTTVQFVVNASGTPAPTYQWQVSTNGGGSWANLANGAPYSGVTTSTLTISGVSGGLNGFHYRAIATNAVASATSTGAILTVGGTQLMQNGDFSNGTTGWLLHATPDPSYISWTIDNGVFKYFRQPPPPGTSNQAVIFQQTGIGVGKDTAFTAGFDIGNSSTVRKRISVLIIDSDFSDLSVCTFWLPANAPLRRYEMRTHSTEVWTNAAIYFYAASAGSNGGHYLLDNVSLQIDPNGGATRTDCIDPIRPAPPGGPDSATLVANGDFSGGMTAWGTYGQIQHQIADGIFQFYRLAGTPAGVVLQGTGAATVANEILTAKFDLGNTSAVRKRVTVLLHDLDFSDLTACTFWLPAGAPLTTYTIRSYSTEAWSNATISVYPATVGLHQWMQLDNVSLQRTPSVPVLGTECAEPGTVLAPSTAAVGGTSGAPVSAAAVPGPPNVAPSAASSSLRSPSPASREAFRKWSDVWRAARLSMIRH